MVITSTPFLCNYYIENPTGICFSIPQMISSAAMVHNWFPRLLSNTCEISRVALITDLCLLQDILVF